MEWKHGGTPVHKGHKGLCPEYVFLQLHKCVFPLPSSLPSQGTEPHNLKLTVRWCSAQNLCSVTKILGPCSKPGPALLMRYMATLL